VLEGIAPGQQVVVSGQFLIDSEASLLGAYQRMETTSQTSPSPAAAAPKTGSGASPGVSETMPPMEMER
jgi:Cu(I)/Ag(I) efflux system membrane fusion protein